MDEKRHADVPGPLPIMRYFSYKHLPTDLAAVSKPFGDLAWYVHDNLHGDPEQKKLCLEGLLLAKDAAVRASLPRNG